MSFFKKLIFDEISISHLQFALYLSLVVQFSMTVALAFSRQPCYYTTLLSSCQYLFKTFFKFFLGVLTGVSCSLFACPLTDSFPILPLFSPFVKYFLRIFFKLYISPKTALLKNISADIFHKYCTKCISKRIFPEPAAYTFS